MLIHSFPFLWQTLVKKIPTEAMWKTPLNSYYRVVYFSTAHKGGLVWFYACFSSKDSMMDMYICLATLPITNDGRTFRHPPAVWRDSSAAKAFKTYLMYPELDLTYFWWCLLLHPRQMLWRWTMQWLLLLSWEITEIKHF